MPSDKKIDRILDNLTKTVAVPRPPAREVRDQKSWRGLKLHQWVLCKRPLHYRNVWIKKNTLMQVTRATNKGVVLNPVGDWTEAVEWVAENWRDYFAPTKGPDHGKAKQGK